MSTTNSAINAGRKLTTNYRDYSEYSKTYGINSDVKTNKGATVNVKSGVSVVKQSSGPFVEVGARIDTATFTYTNKSEKGSASISAPSASISGKAVIGGKGGSVEATVSLAEVNIQNKIDILGYEVTVSGKAGIGASVEGKLYGTHNQAGVGITAPVMPGAYVGVSIDVKK